MQYSLAFHVIGIVFWMGGLIILSRSAAVAQTAEVQRTIRRLWRAYPLSGSAIVLLTGIYQLIIGGFGFYMKQGWMHTKLTLIIVLVVLTVVVDRELASIAGGGEPRRKKLNACHGIAALLLILIVVLTKAGVGV